jgi:hypothetical protein
MALIGNYSVLNKLNVKFYNGTSTAGAFAGVTPSNSNQFGPYLNSFAWFSRISSVPIGYRPPYAFRLAMSDGGIASQTLSTGAITGASTLNAGRNLVGSAACTITVTQAQLDQIVSAVASGSMSIAAAVATLAGAANATASGSGAIAVTNALCGAIFSVTAARACSISGTGSTLTALGNMEASAGGATPLSPEGLAASLLDNEDIETGYSMRESLRLILSSLAGKLSGSPGTTITIRDINDTVDRIVATVDANGNRTAVTKDVS